jgi:hypothetical protein
MRSFLERAYALSIEIEASPDAACRPPGVVDRALSSVSVQQSLLNAHSLSKAWNLLSMDTQPTAPSGGYCGFWTENRGTATTDDN